MNKKQITLLQDTPARINFLKNLFEKEIANGCEPRCVDCFSQFTLELYDLVKEQIPEQIREIITGQDLKIATEWAWKKIKT
jgi:hypothetical protein